MYLLILESIGTSELVLIGIIALIVFGPRKLPQMAKTIGKTMADFRRTTTEFKSTWEKEAEFYKEEAKNLEITSGSENSIPEENETVKIINREPSIVESPQIREVEQEKIDEFFSNIKNQNIDQKNKDEKEDSEKTAAADKREWL